MPVRPPVAQEAIGGGEEERRLEAGEESRRRSRESLIGERDRRERAALKINLGLGGIRGDGGKAVYIPFPLQ